MSLHVELHTPTSAEPIATLTIHPDQTWTVAGNTAAFTRLFDIPVRAGARDATGRRGRVRFSDNPTQWARGLPHELRDGYLRATLRT